MVLHRWIPRVELEGKPVRLVLEGGAIDVNGRGSLLTTEECLLSEVQCRNPGLDRAGLEQVLADYLAVCNVIWLGQGIAGDDTHGHVDDIARFVDPQTIVTVVEPRAGDPNHKPLADNFERLQSARDQDGQSLRVATLPMPVPVVFDGQRLPASYANFYIANRLVLVPTFNDPADRIALEHPGRALPRPPGRRHPLRGSSPRPRYAPLPLTAATESRAARIVTLTGLASRHLGLARFCVDRCTTLRFDVPHPRFGSHRARANPPRIANKTMSMIFSFCGSLAVARICSVFARTCA